jgi:hypothetical protein
MIGLEAQYVGVAKARLTKPRGVVQAGAKVFAGAAHVPALQANRPRSLPVIEGREAQGVHLPGRAKRHEPRPIWR